ncbi:MAG: hypothetical protein Unbinned3325contig1000_1 [Prokaryotic dsDNA virus sp.]|nr:MAG: hypothetical protein Unbinned3325contig1000_1 [Prokaryotic dsDNA virus sp.]
MLYGLSYFDTSFNGLSFDFFYGTLHKTLFSLILWGIRYIQTAQIAHPPYTLNAHNAHLAQNINAHNAQIKENTCLFGGVFVYTN